MDEVDAQIVELRELTLILLDDVQQTAKAGVKAFPHENRNLVRAVFASCRGGPGRLSAGELAMLIEEDYDLEPSGNGRVNAARSPFLSNFRFAA